MSPKRTWVIHPYPVALFPVLSLYAHNISYILANDIWAPSAFLLACAGLLLLANKLFFKTWQKAGVWVSCFWLLFFSYQAVHHFLINSVGKALAKQSLLLFTILVLLTVLGIHLRRQKHDPSQITKVLNLTAFLLLLMPLVQIALFEIKWVKAIDSTATQRELVWQPTAAAVDKPDIVYIILDGLGSPNALVKNYWVEDVTDFTDFLQKEGFFIAPKSYANYSRTAVSLASSLNAEYLQKLPGYHQKLTYIELDKMVENANVLKWLQTEGYQLYSFPTSYKNAELEHHATFVSPFPAQNSSLQELLFYLTPLPLLETNAFLYGTFSWFKLKILGKEVPAQKAARLHYEKILFTLQHVPKYIGQAQPSFVFADIFVGHPPFVFTKEGNFQAPPAIFTNPILDGNHFIRQHPGGRQAYINGYQDQVSFFIPRLMELVKQIKLNATRPTVIILQGDHGPGANYHQEDVTKTNLPERFGIFNAIYTSDRQPTFLPKNLSPVNTFRHLFNSYFKTDFPILPNHHYFSPADHPADVIDVTAQIKAAE